MMQTFSLASMVRLKHKELFMSLNEEEQKKLYKEALKEWLDAQFLMFGKWSAGAIAAAVIAALTYFMLKMSGWVKIN